MKQQIQICRHCKEPFVPAPDEVGYIDECPTCKPGLAQPPSPRTSSRSRRVQQRYIVAPLSLTRKDKNKIVTYIRLMKPAFAKSSSKEIFERWKTAYLKSAESAKIVLKNALQNIEADF